MAPQTIPEVRAANLFARAMSLLQEERIHGRRLKGYEIRIITSANKLLISSTDKPLVQDETAIAFETELRLSLANLRKLAGEAQLARMP